MRNRAWRWTAAGFLLCWLGSAGTAWADRIYLKNGTSVWGDFAEDLGTEVTIFQGGRTLRFRKEEVLQIEKKQTNLPDHQVATPPPAHTPSGSGSVIPDSSGGSSGSSSGSSGGGGRRY
jgi:uncharacterized membrane protein YgcG